MTTRVRKIHAELVLENLAKKELEAFEKEVGVTAREAAADFQRVQREVERTGVAFDEFGRETAQDLRTVQREMERSAATVGRELDQMVKETRDAAAGMSRLDDVTKREMSSVAAQIDRTSRSAVADFKKIERQADQSGLGLGRLARQVLGLYAAIQSGRVVLNTGFGFIKDSSDFEEQLSRFKIVFGEFSGEAAAALDTLGQRVGRSRADLVQYAGDFQAFTTTMGLTTEEAKILSLQLTELGIDLASFNNIADSEAFEKIRSGLAGETDSIKTLGVDVFETTKSLKALELGFKTNSGELSQLQRMLTTIALVFEQTSSAQGDATRTANSFANTMKRIAGESKDIRVALGKNLKQVVLDEIENLGGIPAVIEGIKVGYSAAAGATRVFIRSMGILTRQLQKVVEIAGGPTRVGALLRGDLDEAKVAVETFGASLEFLRGVAIVAFAAIADSARLLARSVVQEFVSVPDAFAAMLDSVGADDAADKIRKAQEGLGQTQQRQLRESQAFLAATFGIYGAGVDALSAAAKEGEAQFARVVAQMDEASDSIAVDAAGLKALLGSFVDPLREAEASPLRFADITQKAVEDATKALSAYKATLGEILDASGDTTSDVKVNLNAEVNTSNGSGLTEKERNFIKERIAEIQRFVKRVNARAAREQGGPGSISDVLEQSNRFLQAYVNAAIDANEALRASRMRLVGGSNEVGNEEFERGLAKMAAGFARVAAASAKSRAELSDFELGAMQAAREFGEQFSDANLGRNLTGEVFGSLVSGIDAFSRALVRGEADFGQFAQSIIQDIAAIAVRSVILKSLGFAFQGTLFGTALGFAEGGVMPGRMVGGLPIKKYAQGGIADTPQLAVFGEGRGAEAFVPLGNDRRIPVRMEGGAASSGPMSVTINVESLDPHKAAEVLQRAMPDIERRLADALMTGRSRSLVTAVADAARRSR